MTLIHLPLRITAVLAACTLVAGAELRPQLASADSVSYNISALRQRSVATSGTAMGNATAGPAVAYNDLALVQSSRQRGGGRYANQTAVNSLELDQLAVAQSGNATGLDGATASSGAATAGNLAIVQQTNDQSISGAVPEGGVEQTAVNLAQIGQLTTAGSGEAYATGQGASATSGDADALGLVVVQQETRQSYEGPAGGSATGSVQQSAASIATVDQATGVISGRATASVSSTGSSGSASSSARTVISQGTVQVGGE